MDEQLQFNNFHFLRIFKSEVDARLLIQFPLFAMLLIKTRTERGIEYSISGCGVKKNFGRCCNSLEMSS